ncbi:MAG: hypothetical protein DHS20C09_18100 [marine bacterium B5-7]|nr:MAG: hypothetical protein DHS20C09_18100 [marine bacterium B5-7]
MLIMDEVAYSKDVISDLKNLSLKKSILYRGCKPRQTEAFIEYNLLEGDLAARRLLRNVSAI